MDFRIYRDEAGGWRWLLAEAGTPVLAPRRSFPTEQACRTSVAAVRQQVLIAPAVQMGVAAPGLFAAG
ncbi:MAG: hypothetical protein U1F45_00990 [Burkholderiales bacterium]|nr:hypothetical protein [Anaerolineae bacterium]